MFEHGTEPDRPIFILVGGQGTVEEEELPRTLAFHIARTHNGTFIYLEHRFYGFSGNTNSTMNKLKYLQVHQALADLDAFVTYIKGREHTNNTAAVRVILMGWRYGGSLAVWYQHRYPNKVAGVWASSASLLAKTNYQQYMSIVGTMIRYIGGDDCYRRIDVGIARAEALYASQQYEQLDEEFFVCNSSTSTSHIRVLTARLAQEFGTMVQYGLWVDEYDEAFSIRYFDWFAFQARRNIEQLCSTCCLARGFRTRLVPEEAIQPTLPVDQWRSCNRLFEVHGATMGVPTVLGHGRHTEYRWRWTSIWHIVAGSAVFQRMRTAIWLRVIIEINCSADRNILMHINSGRFTRSNIERNAMAFNAINGGLNPNVTNVLFVNGANDPNISLQVQKPLNINSTTVIVVEGIYIYNFDHFAVILIEVTCIFPRQHLQARANWAI